LCRCRFLAFSVFLAGSFAPTRPPLLCIAQFRPSGNTFPPPFHLAFLPPAFRLPHEIGFRSFSIDPFPLFIRTVTPSPHPPPFCLPYFLDDSPAISLKPPPLRILRTLWAVVKSFFCPLSPVFSSLPLIVVQRNPAPVTPPPTPAPS